MQRIQRLRSKNSEASDPRASAFENRGIKPTRGPLGRDRPMPCRRSESAGGQSGQSRAQSFRDGHPGSRSSISLLFARRECSIWITGQPGRTRDWRFRPTRGQSSTRNWICYIVKSYLQRTFGKLPADTRVAGQRPVPQPPLFLRASLSLAVE